jgi:hypothetical protein
MGYTEIASRPLTKINESLRATFEYYCPYCNQIFGKKESSMIFMPSDMMQLAKNHICEGKKKDIDNTKFIPIPDFRYCPQCGDKIKEFSSITGKAIECWHCGWRNK